MTSDWEGNGPDVPQMSAIKRAAINVLSKLWAPRNIFWIFFTYFYNSLSPNFPPQECSHPLFFHSSRHTCMCLLCFCAIVTMPLPDAHKMGLSGKTFATHISHKGSLWPITVWWKPEILTNYMHFSCLTPGYWPRLSSHCQRGVVSGNSVTDVQGSGT